MESIPPALFTFDVPILEIVVRGSLMYLGTFVILRIILKREVGSVGIPDLLMITMIADAAQNGMAGEYKTISSGLLLVLVLVFWNSVLDWLTFRYEWFECLTRAKPLLLVRNGRAIHHNLRRASVSNSELMAFIRKEGIEHLNGVKAVYLEGNGDLSVIPKGK